MRLALAALAILACNSEATALGFPATCRGPAADIIKLEGLDTQRARAEAHYTIPDAISQCHYELGRAVNKPSPNAAALSKCVDEFMSDPNNKKMISVEANCRIGIIGMPNLKSKDVRKLPLGTSCAEGGDRFSTLFQTLCPSYEGKVKEYD